MSTSSRWIFVDDQQQPAQSFADALSQTQLLEVVVVSPAEAKDRLLKGDLVPDGVLMDIDLSNAAGLQGSGPGIAQDIRVKQKAHEIPEYPIVRFAAVEQVLRNVHGDPASDDLFDLKIAKEKLRNGVEPIIRQILGAGEIYRALHTDTMTEEQFLSLLGVSADQWAWFGHPAFAARLQYSARIATHVAAGTFIRSFICASGLLIDEALLAVRLGINNLACDTQWQELKVKMTEFAYRGAGSQWFSRWWARGLDEWWHSAVGGDSPLSSVDIGSRVGALTEKLGVAGLVPLEMPRGSAGSKPWRYCSLSAEASPPVWVPLDPTESVRLTGSVDLPPWVDPPYAALGPALQAHNDFRRNQSDLDRLRRKYNAA